MNGLSALSLLVLLLALAVADVFPAPATDDRDAVLEFEATTEPVPADRSAVLSTQFSAGVRGSRAPPTQSA